MTLDLGVAERAAALRGVPLFEGMTDRAIEHVASIARTVEFGAGTELMHEGDAGDAFYIVIDGALAISKAGRTLTRLGAGDFLGEIALVDGRPRTATATALEAVRALVIDRPAFLGLVDDSGPVRLGVLMALTERIRRDAAGERD